MFNKKQESHFEFVKLEEKIYQQQKEIEILKEKLNYTTALLQNTIDTMTGALSETKNKTIKLTALVKKLYYSEI